MDSNLILYDMNHFLDKYTRFMTKDIYISSNMYQRFLDQYQYLYELLGKNQFLYSDNSIYKKMMDIKKNRYQLIKLHNQKYLKKVVKEYQNFFEDVCLDDELDLRLKSIILSEEDKMLVIQNKNVEGLIAGKFVFLSKKYNYLDSQILILVEDMKQKKMISTKLEKKGINAVVKTVNEYGMYLLERDELVLDDDRKYILFSRCIIKQLFPQKKLFQRFYEAFSKYIYLNKDYKDYETFKDYHSYMYKRRLLASGVSLKKFNEQEIKKRKNYLRTIKNEVMKTKEEVDIANFLYLNSIRYQYNSKTSIFSICLGEKSNNIKFVSVKEPLEIKNIFIDGDIYLYSSYNDKKTFLEVLAYELIKRRYPLELVDDDIVYSKLKDTTILNYFSEFIRNYLIPTIDYYEKNKSLEDTRLSREQQKIIKELYLMYEKEVTQGHYVREQELFSRIEEDILEKKYRYLFLVGDISINLKIPTMTIVSDYQEVQLLRENIKLLYDYKRYIYQNQRLPIAHVMQDYQELNSLTASFLKENLAIINKALEENKKEIDIQCYDDQNRLHIYQNIGECCEEILKDNKKNVMFGFTNLKDMKLLISSKKFSKCDKNTLFDCEKRNYPCEEILNISRVYDTIILPYLIKDYYHEDFLRNDDYYYIKVMLYVALSKCREKLVVLCPESRKQELTNILKRLGKKMVVE